MTKVDYPKQLTVMVTSRCNLRCKLCFQSEYRSDLNPSILDKMRHVYFHLDWFHPIGGEPLLYDLKKLYDLPFSDRCKFKIITNGTLITPEQAVNIVRNVDRLIVSVDGGTEDAYREMRGFSLEKVLRGIERVQSCKTETGNLTPHIEINFLLTKSTVDTLPTLAAWAASNGVDCINTFYPVYNNPAIKSSEEICKEEAKVSILKAKRHMKIIEPERRGGDECRRPWNTCFVDVNGNVSLCCFGSPSLGNLNEKSFDDCWFGPLATKIRETVNTEKEIRQCKKCPVR
ncbi:radical SAM protein [Desulfosarcina ovata]|uniref:radical SAM protein n=1 Tax=Desulfosarcina ovata TaxID=83564 RepID=UPI0012D35A18|nr:radical SAM protein [Desulfosarcina ovata]